jgi:hypothetical protein
MVENLKIIGEVPVHFSTVESSTFLSAQIASAPISAQSAISMLLPVSKAKRGRGAYRHRGAREGPRIHLQHHRYYK